MEHLCPTLRYRQIPVPVLFKQMRTFGHRYLGRGRAHELSWVKGSARGEINGSGVDSKIEARRVRLVAACNREIRLPVGSKTKLGRG